MSGDARTIADTILRRLGEIPGYREGRLRYEPTSPTLADLEPLARDYLRLTGANAARRLGLVGPYLVMEDAALEFGAVARIQDDTMAHFELTVRMFTASPVGDRRGWRARDSSWDITAQTDVIATSAGPLIRVVSTMTRPTNHRGNYVRPRQAT